MAGRGLDRVFERRLSALVNSREQRLLGGGRRGLERETLRVRPDGRIAHTPHPHSLGSALTHAHITTDYSEALLELVTPPLDDNAALLSYLEALERFVYLRLGEELLWSSSMPCELAGDDDVPIARYGDSHAGRIKSIYRRGLRWRYGGTMQAISGVHFNFSFPQAFWPLYQELCQARGGGQPFISERYFDLLRNYRRHGWIVSYLFGVSPALCRSFLAGRAELAAGDHGGRLEPHGRETLIGPSATSLRMSDFGYRNRSQAAVSVSANSLEHYLRDLRDAVHRPSAQFGALGVCVDGEYRQLSANVLQIENEYYTYIRPKRVPQGQERAVAALRRGGVQYVEVRALDNCPFHASGVASTTLGFLEALLVLLLLKESPPIDAGEEAEIDANHLLVARRGREPGLELVRAGRPVPLRAWAAELLDSLEGICELLDSGQPASPYASALAAQRAKLEDSEQTPSAQFLRALAESGEEFSALTLRLSGAHRERLLRAPEARESSAQQTADQTLEAEAEESLLAQASIESRQRGSFEAYLASYLADESAG